MSEFGSDINDTNEGFDDIDDTEEGSDASESFDWGGCDPESLSGINDSHETVHSIDGSHSLEGRERGHSSGTLDSSELDGRQTNREGFAMDNGSDFAINQILDTPRVTDSRMEAQQSLETMHKQSNEVILSKYGDRLDEQARTRMQEGTRLYAVDYLGRGVSGVHNLDTSHPTPALKVAMNSETQMRCTDMHENLHNASFHEQTVEYNKETGLYHIEQRVGSHHVSYDVNESGERLNIKELDRALNEAITHNRTLDCLSESDAQYADARSGYRDAADMAKELEGILGKDAIDGSYFQGQDTMREAMEALVPGSYERFSSNLEEMTYSHSLTDKAIASIDNSHLLSELQEAKAKAEAKGKTTA